MSAAPNIIDFLIWTGFGALLWPLAKSIGESFVNDGEDEHGGFR